MTFCFSTTSAGGGLDVFEDIKEKIEMVLNDEKLQQEMIQKGLQRAKEFTWEKSAKEHLEVFEEVLRN